ncbi:MAG: conjugal transfer protein TraF [Gammaproteobacteria bacterium]|nr:conjugal transfer protein TraF [Gammaproteobacteria bacterium]
MLTRIFRDILGIVAFAAPLSTLAAPFLVYDARSMGLGGAGVAIVDNANAALVNPALLGLNARHDRFNLVVPSATLMLSDRGNIRGAWADYKRNAYDEKVSASVKSFNTEVQRQIGLGTPDYVALSPLRDDVVANSRAMLAVLERFSDHWLGVQGNAGAVLGAPDPDYGVSLFWNTWAVGGAKIEITSQDVDLLNTLLNTAESVTPQNYQTILDALALSQRVTDPTDKLLSNFQGRMSSVKEYGFALARQTHWFGEDIAFGFSPKVLDITLYDYKYVVRDLKKFAWKPEQWKSNQNDLNADVGVAARVHGDYYIGMVAKNVFARSYTTRFGNTISFNPQWRLGAAYTAQAWLVTADFDVVPNIPASLESRSQFLGAGVEWRTYSWLKLRIGMRHDVETQGDVFTTGMGIALWSLHLDTAVVVNKNELGAALQLGVVF